MMFRQNTNRNRVGNVVPLNQKRPEKQNTWKGRIEGGKGFLQADPERENIMFVLDTNVLMTKPESLFGFEEHNILLPWKVLLELDKGKSGDSERSMNARRTIEYLVTLVESVSYAEILRGIPLIKPGEKKHRGVGKLFFAIPNYETLQRMLDPTIPDHAILIEYMRAREGNRYKKKLVLVSKDKVMRILASLLDIPAEDYFDDAIDAKKLNTGICGMPLSFLERQKQIPEEREGRLYYTLSGSELTLVNVNEVLLFEDKKKNICIDLQVMEKKENGNVIARKLINYQKKSIFGIYARNREQSIALNFLLDPAIKVVILEGPAGSGKNFITLLAAFHQILHEERFERIVATRDAIPVGEQTGFKPGDEREKMLPWMGGMVDNISQIQKLFNLFSGKKRKQGSENGDSENLARFVELKELNSMRGCSIQNTFLVFDENQNSTREQQRLVLTRHGNGSKTVCLGNFRQTDRFLTSRTSGFARVISIIQGVSWGVHIVMPKVERSEVAEFFEEHL